jgi:hypothetical protein
MSPRFILCFFILLFVFRPLFGEDHRTQYPAFLSNSYFGLQAGYIDFPFTNEQLEAGFHAESIELKHKGIRIFFGHELNRRFSAQISYMKPLRQTDFQNINADQSDHTVWMHAGTITLRRKFAVGGRSFLYAEGGLGIATRRGFDINNTVVVKNKTYANPLLGAGFDYPLNENWDFSTGFTFLPGRKAGNQPHTIFFSGGFNYTMRPLTAAAIEENSAEAFVFPGNFVQFEFSTDGLGYGINDFVSKKPLDIFWAGKVEVAHGFWMRYQHNIFHTRKIFSLDEGASFGYWKSRTNGEGFYTLSVFPVFRFTVIHSQVADFYFDYSVAGPSFISRTDIDQLNTGRHFTFQDFMGVGVFTGKNRRVNLEMNLDHYSNGNIFADNAAVKVPLSFALGFTF